MGVVFYRQGKTHKVNGIKCELIVLDPKRIRGGTPEGWYKSPEEAYEIKESKEIEEVKEEPETKAEEIEENEVLDIDKLHDHEVREVARNAGIEDYDTARFRTLRRELKKWQQAI